MDLPPPLVPDLGLKRKRSPLPVEEVRPLIHPGNITPINYLTKVGYERLRLIEGDNGNFNDILGLIEDYEGVLQRHESLAGNLGAKLVGPLLLKSFEKLFDGPIKTIQPSFANGQPPITWLDIVNFARTNPGEFHLSENYPYIQGHKTCRFWIRECQFEISEDDYRLIMSGGPERMIPTQAIPEDESAELATLNILEGRLALLIKKADAVASKARQLNYHLKGRKTAVLARKAAELEPPEAERTQPFSAINAQTRSPGPTNSDGGKLQQQLLEQFLTNNDRRQSLPASAPHPPRPKAHRVSDAEPANFVSSPFNGESSTGHDNRGVSQPLAPEDGLELHFKVLMATRIEKLGRGDKITPPCDRCRRLKFECTKHLTACQACTKKHAKCSWKDIMEGELDVPLLIPSRVSQGEGGQQILDGEGEGEGNGFVVTEPVGASAPALHFEMGAREKETDKEKERKATLEEEAAILTQIAMAASR